MVEFSGWQRAGGSPRSHYFQDGVSACGRFVDSQVKRGFRRGEVIKHCGNCEKRLAQRRAGKKNGKGKRRGSGKK